MLDTLGATLAASTLGDGCRQVAQHIGADPGVAEATVLGFGGRASAVQAAFANGALAHALNFDALGAAGGHLGVAAVIAPLVMAERQGAVSGRELLTAVAVAAEFTARLAGALSAAGINANEKFLEGQLLSYLGAAAGAGHILRLPEDRMHSALGLALMQSAGSRQVSFDGGAAKAIYGAFANQGAVLSALLAAQGLDARCDVLEGAAGVYALFYGGRYDAGFLADGLGERFHAQQTVFKPWATSGMLHPFIEACLELRTRFHAAEIERVAVTVAPQAKAWLHPDAERRRPRNAATAANSIFFGVAKTLVNAGLTLADFTPAGLAQPEALALAGAIEATVGAPAAVAVTLKNGHVIEAPVPRQSRAMDFAALTAKFRDCARHAARPVAPAALDEAIERIANLESMDDAAILPGLLAGSRM